MNERERIKELHWACDESQKPAGLIDYARITKLLPDVLSQKLVPILREALDGWLRALDERDEAAKQASTHAAWDEATEDARRFAAERDEARDLVRRLMGPDISGAMAMEEAESRLRAWEQEAK